MAAIQITQAIPINALTLLYAGFTPEQIQEAESGVDVHGPLQVVYDDEPSLRLWRELFGGPELPKMWPTRRRAGQNPTYDIQKLGIDMNIWYLYRDHNNEHIIQFINIAPQLFWNHSTLYEVIIEGWVPEHGALLKNAQSYQMFKSYLRYQFHKTSRGAGRKKKIRRRRKSKRKSKKKTKRRKKRTRRRR